MLGNGGRMGTVAATLYALTVLVAYQQIINGLSFLGGLAATAVGLGVAGTGLVLAMGFKPSVQGVGQALVGAGGVLTGLASAFNVSVGIAGPAVIAIGLGLIVVGAGLKHIPFVGKFVPG